MRNEADASGSPPAPAASAFYGLEHRKMTVATGTSLYLGRYSRNLMITGGPMSDTPTVSFPATRTLSMSDPVDATTFRETMRRLPSPVVVVTMTDGHEVRGITIGSFTSVSLDPPLISFNVTKTAESHRILQETERFVVHILGENQVHLAKHFAKPHLSGIEQFEEVAHQVNEHGIPVLEDVTSVMHCERHSLLPAADHTLILGVVTNIRDNDDDGAVLYYQSSYRSVGSELRSSLLPPVNSSASESS